MGRQHQRMDRPGVRQVPEGSGEQGKMEKIGCRIICGAPTTLAVKGLAMGGDDDDCLSKRYTKVPEVVFATFCEDYQGKLTTLLEPLHTERRALVHIRGSRLISISLLLSKDMKPPIIKGKASKSGLSLSACS